MSARNSKSGSRKWRRPPAGTSAIRKRIPRTASPGGPGPNRRGVGDGAGQLKSDGRIAAASGVAVGTDPQKEFRTPALAEPGKHGGDQGPGHLLTAPAGICPHRDQLDPSVRLAQRPGPPDPLRGNPSRPHLPVLPRDRVFPPGRCRPGSPSGPGAECLAGRPTRVERPGGLGKSAGLDPLSSSSPRSSRGREAPPRTQPGLGRVPPKLRPARAPDGGRIAEIYRAAVRQAVPGLQLAHTDREIRSGAAEELLTQHDVWITECGGGITGFMALRRDRSWVDQLYIAPAAQGVARGRPGRASQRQERGPAAIVDLPAHRSGPGLVRASRFPDG